MNLPTDVSVQLQSNSVSERVEAACRLAKELEKAGDYEGAKAALAEFWPSETVSGSLDKIDEGHRAELLLRIGNVAGWLGSANQSGNSQELAKNYLTQSIEIFDGLGQTKRVAEARGDLGLCYWREGAYDEARIQLATALDLLGEEDGELKAVLLIRAGIVEVWAQRVNEALRFYYEAA